MKGTVGVPGSFNTYSTGIPGLGLRFSFGGGTSATYYPYTINWPALNAPNGPYSVPSSNTLYVELVKTGTITTSGTISGEVAGWFFENGVTKMVSIVVNGGITIKPAVPTCTVMTPTLNVPLGNNVPTSAFKGVGTTSSSSGQPFNIQLQCSGGASGAVTSMYMTLTDQTNPGNVSNVLSLAAGSTATGVGIQVQNGGTIVGYGPDSSVTGNTNQWYVGQSGNGTVNIPLTARYVQTGAVVTPGSANGIATFTMSYQ
jgi:type 1 fimbria pilin